MTVSQQRAATENALLEQYFGKVYWFVDHTTVCVEVGLATNSGARYAVRLVLPNDYPDRLPEALITHPLGLTNYVGDDLAELGPSLEMHLLTQNGPHASICHYHPARWAADMTLYKVVMKARIWLEAYEMHARTGKPLDSYLKHMTGTP